MLRYCLAIFPSFAFLAVLLAPYSYFITAIYSHPVLHLYVLGLVAFLTGICIKYFTLKRLRTYRVFENRNVPSIVIPVVMAGSYYLILYLMLGVVLPHPSARFNSQSPLMKFLHWPILKEYLPIGMSPLPDWNFIYYSADVVIFSIGIAVYTYILMRWPWSTTSHNWLPMYKFGKRIKLFDLDILNGNITLQDLINANVETSEEAYCELIAYTNRRPSDESFVGILYCLRENINHRRVITAIKFLAKTDYASFGLLEQKYGPLVKTKYFINWIQVKERL